MKYVQEKQENCCGCSACYSICPKGAINMVADLKGFKYPQIDEEKCVKCGLCEKVCDFVKFVANESSTVDCYAVRHKKPEEVRTSRSGAFFMAVSDYVLKQEGVVFGAEFKSVDYIAHSAEIDKDGINLFKGSKYVQSDMNNCFTECMELLEKGETVLFSGTACQIHGLKSLLKIKKIPMDKLYLIDIVCHGVPSPLLWKYFIEGLEKLYGKKIKIANFRDKEKFGWAEHRESFIFDDDTTTTTNWSTCFYAHTMFRESCYSCPYTTPYRESDITIADYWGIENNASEFDDDKGVSLVIVQSDKGRKLFENIKDLIDYRQTDINNSLQHNLKAPSEKGNDYERFWLEFQKYSQDVFMKRWFFKSKFRVIMLKIYKITRKIIRRIKMFLLKLTD